MIFKYDLTVVSSYSLMPLLSDGVAFDTIDQTPGQIRIISAISSPIAASSHITVAMC